MTDKERIEEAMRIQRENKTAQQFQKIERAKDAAKLHATSLIRDKAS